MSDVTINVTVTQGGTIDADLEGATVINTSVEEGGVLSAEVIGGGTGPQGPTGDTGATGDTGPAGPQGEPGVVQSIVAGDNIDVDDTDPANPIVAVEALTKSDVGLGNVDNTSDANKPVSTAQGVADALVASNAATALSNHEADTTNVHGITDTSSLVVGPSSVTDDNPVTFDGSTGKLIKQKTYAAFKTLLALVKGDVGLGNVDNVQQQPLDADLTTIAGLTATTDNFMVATASAWASRTPTQARSQLGLGSIALLSTITEADITLADNTTNNFSTTKHGFVPKGTNVGSFLKDDGTWDAIPGGGDMLASTYDPANIAQQLVGLTAAQVLTNKEISGGVVESSVFNDKLTTQNITLPARNFAVLDTFEQSSSYTTEVPSGGTLEIYSPPSVVTPNNPYCFRAYDSGGTTLTDGNEVQINFATEEYDLNNIEDVN